MNLTLLLDLDGTLLENSVEDFLPRYLSAFASEVSEFIDPDKFVKALLAGTNEMVNNKRPDCTLREVFDSVFYPKVGVEKSEFQPIEDRFYAEVFPKLKSLSRPKPDAIRLVDQALKRDSKLTIATNPLFPRTAILHRLEWANLSAGRYPFNLVSSIETFHFAKPERTFYAELLGRLGWPTGPLVMLGDDLKRDIIPSYQIGLSTYWVKTDESRVDNDDHPFIGGSLDDFFPWLDRQPEISLEPDYASPSAMLAILRATPAVLDTLCREIHPALWIKRPQLNGWALTEILCHLRDVDQEVNLPRLQKVIAETNPFLPGKDTDQWAEERQYIHQDGTRAFGQFVAARLKLLDLLEALEPDGWQRKARHAIFGPSRLEELVNMIAGHDRLHLQQVQQLLSLVSASQ